MDGVSAVLESIGSSICNMTAERKLRQLQQDACADAQAVQATKVLASSPQRKHVAMHHLQQTETHLDPDYMITLVDLISGNTIAANVYMSFKQEDYHWAWISKWLKELGFIDGVTVNI